MKHFFHLVNCLFPNNLATFVLTYRVIPGISATSDPDLLAFLKTVLLREANYIKAHGSLASASPEMLSYPLFDPLSQMCCETSDVQIGHRQRVKIRKRGSRLP